MLALELEQALRQLEEATESLLATETADLVALCRALDQRADAITKVALISEGAGRGTSAVERLAAVMVQGESATRKLLGLRREASGEMGRLKYLRSGIDPEPEAGPGSSWEG